MLEKLKGLRPPKLTCGCSMFLLLLGLFCVGGLFWLHVRQEAFAQIGQTTTGRVIELVRGGGKGKGYSSIVQFLTPDEHVYSFKTFLWSDPPVYAIGDKVDVLYNPEKPEEAVMVVDNSITTNHTMWLIGAFGVGLIVLGISSILATFVRWRQRLRA